MGAASTVFEAYVLLAKAFMILFLLILSFVNAHGDFAGKNPKLFVGESMLVGGLTALAFAFIAWARRMELSGIFNTALTAFLVFFIFNVFMEFSGFNQASVDVEKLSDSDKKRNKLIMDGGKWVIGGGAAVAILLAAIVRDTNFYSWGWLSTEAFVFALSGAVPVIMIAKDRKEKDGAKIAKDFFIMFALFFFAHFVLQFGGFYTHIFSDKSSINTSLNR